MRNKLLTLLTVTMLAGSLLVGCGGNETGADVNNGGTNTEANINDGVAAKIDSGKYKEYEYYYGFLNEEDIDKTYVDGTSLTTLTWEQVNMTIKIKESVNLYNPNKELVGLSKPNIDCTYILTNEEWSFVAFGTNFESNDTYPNGAAYVRTDELMAVAEITGSGNVSAIGDEDTNSVETEVTEEELYAFAKEICDEAGFVYDESAFSNVNLEDIDNFNTLAGYSYRTSNFPIDNKDEIREDLVQFFNKILVDEQSKGYNGVNYIIESIEIREPNYGEGSSKQYVYRVYMKVY